MTKPSELVTAELVLGVCDRFKCLPSQALAEDAGVIRLLKIEAMGRTEDPPL